MQGEKIRAIDDLCESNTNAAHAACEKIWLMDTDYISAGISQVERIVTKDKTEIVDSMDTVYEVQLHQSWSNGSEVNWKGRTIDLKAAYKQLHVCPQDR